MKFLGPYLISAAISGIGTARDFRPAGRMENLPGEDASIRQCYVFQTVPGVRYTVETSDDLGTWTPHETITALATNTW